jgi:hypothetical protein
MCIKFLDWFNNEFLFLFESKHHNIKIIIIDEPTISHINSYKLIESHESKLESIESHESKIESIESKDEYDLYTWDIL